jgi:hypothetical protein
MAPLLPTARRGRPSRRLPVLPLLGAVVGVGWLLVRCKPLAAHVRGVADSAFIHFLLRRWVVRLSARPQLMVRMARSADWSLAQPPPPSGTVTPAALTHGNPRSLTGARLCVVAHVDDLHPEESTLHGLGILVQGLAAEYAEVLVLAVAGDGDVAVDPALVLSHLTTPAEESVRQPKTLRSVPDPCLSHRMTVSV